MPKPQAELFYIWLKIAVYNQCSKFILFIFSVQRSFKKEVKRKKKPHKKETNNKTELLVRCWNITFARCCSENFPWKGNGEVRKVFQSYKLRWSRITTLHSRSFGLIYSAEVLVFPFVGAPGAHGARRQWLFPVLLRIEWADPKGTNMMAPGKWYSDLILLPASCRASTYPSLPSSENLMDIRPAKEGDLSMGCLGLHCSVWSWLSSV